LEIHDNIIVLASARSRKTTLRGRARTSNQRDSRKVLQF